jgi:ActR/RegA family two-component response regulator
MSTSLAAKPTRRAPKATPTILVVDAGATFGLSLNRSLRRYGYDVRLATSPDHAVRTVQARNVDFMIVHDDRSGRGRAALACVRGINRKLPVALISCEPVEEGMQELDPAAGPVHLFGKPLDLPSIVSAIERALVPADPQPNLPLCRIPLADRPTHREMPAIDAVEHRPEPPALSSRPTRQWCPDVAVEPPSLPLHRRRTVRVRAPDAGVYSFVNRQQVSSDRCHAT